MSGIVVANAGWERNRLDNGNNSRQLINSGMTAYEEMLSACAVDRLEVSCERC